MFQLDKKCANYYITHIAYRTYGYLVYLEQATVLPMRHNFGHTS